MSYPAGTRILCNVPGCERPLAELAEELQPGDVLRAAVLRELEAAKPIQTGGTLDCPEHGPIQLRPMILRSPEGAPISG